MFINERYEKILDILNKRKSVSVNHLSEELGYSPATIRSDLNNLNKQGLLIRTHGGAVVKENEPEKSPLQEDFEYRQQRNQKEKISIARKSLSFIEDSMCIILDASSTCYELAKLLNQSNLRLTVLTNGLQIAQLLKNNPQITTILIGGVVKGNSNAIEGLLGSEILDKLNIDAAFLSAQGFNQYNGLTDFSLYEVELKKKMVLKAANTYALLDYTKLEQTSVASFAESSQIDVLITDANVNPQVIDQYKSSGLNVLQVSPMPQN